MSVVMSFVTVVLLFFGIIQTGNAIHCYECVSRLGPSQGDACLFGDEYRLKRVTCIGPSVCAAYHYQTISGGIVAMHHITRGCQAIRYGETCEDIFHQLRARNEILPGQHTCTTCSTDFCNEGLRVRPMVEVGLLGVVMALGQWFL